MAQEELYKEIQSALYMGETSWRTLQETLSAAGALKAWYRASRRSTDRQSGYREVNWFLTEDTLIRQEINPTEIFMISFQLKQLTHIERYYDVSDKNPVLRRTVLTFSDGKTCDLSIPSRQTQGDIEGYIRLVNMIA